MFGSSSRVNRNIGFPDSGSILRLKGGVMKITTELLLRIVSAERDCPACKGTGNVGAHLPSGNNEGNAPWVDPTYPEPCAGCGGTGKVPSLSPELMRLPCPGWRRKSGQDVPCLALRPDWWKIFGPPYLGEVDPCGGLCWIPNPDAWDMKKALHQVGFYLVESHITLNNVNAPFVAICFLEKAKAFPPASDCPPVWDADPERARFLAVAKAFGIAGPE